MISRPIELLCKEKGGGGLIFRLDRTDEVVYMQLCTRTHTHTHKQTDVSFGCVRAGSLARHKHARIIQLNASADRHVNKRRVIGRAPFYFSPRQHSH